MTITRLHHAQITIAREDEGAGRARYCDPLGLPTIARPAPLAGRGVFFGKRLEFIQPPVIADQGGNVQALGR